MFRNVKVGDKVFDYLRQDWGAVKSIGTSLYSLEVEFNYGDTINYTLSGKLFQDYAVQTLFWDEVKPIIPPKKPLPELEIDTKVIVWDEDRDKKHKRYFSHFDENGNIYCFSYGKTSWTKDYIVMWRNWELAKD